MFRVPGAMWDVADTSSRWCMRTGSCVWRKQCALQCAFCAEPSPPPPPPPPPPPSPPGPAPSPPPESHPPSPIQGLDLFMGLSAREIRERELSIRLAAAVALSGLCFVALVCLRARCTEGSSRGARGGRHQRLSTAEDDLDGAALGAAGMEARGVGKPTKMRQPGRTAAKSASGDEKLPREPAETGHPPVPSKKSLRALLADEDLIALTRFEHSTEA